MTHRFVIQCIRSSEFLSAILFLGLTLPWIWARGLQNPDELRYAAVVLEMISRADYMTPYLNGVPYFEKPPLIYWLGVLSVKLFGNHIGVYRVCSLLSGLGIVVLSVKFGHYYNGARVSLYSGLIAATMGFVFVFSQGFTPDILVAFWMTLAIWFLFKTLQPNSETRGQRTDIAMFYLSCSLAVLSKGLIGIVLPIFILVAYAACNRSFAPILKLCRWEGAVIFMGLCLPWHFILEARHPGFLNFYVINEHLLRYSTAIHQREKAFWYLPTALILGTFPWSFFTLPALFSTINRRYGHTDLPDMPRFLKLWALLLLVFFWLSKSLLPGYLLPVIVPISVLIGGYLFEHNTDYVGKGCAALSALCLAAALFFIPHIKTTLLSSISSVEANIFIVACIVLMGSFAYQAYHGTVAVPLIAITTVPLFLVTGYIAAAYEPKSLRAFFLEGSAWSHNRDVVVYKSYLLDPVFYLGKPVIFVDRISELNYGNRVKPRNDLFWSAAQFSSEIAQGRRFVVIGRENDLRSIDGLHCFAKKDSFAICNIN